MGFMDELKKLAQPYDDEDDFYEGADSAFTSSPSSSSAGSFSSNQLNFDEAFAAEESNKEVKKPRKPFFAPAEEYESSAPKAPKPKASKKRPGGETQVLLFNPKNFDDAGELATYLAQNRSLVMALEGVPTETARRLLDFISGIAFAMNAKITPVSAKTYFITPENVDLLDVQAQQEDNDNDF